MPKKLIIATIVIIVGAIVLGVILFLVPPIEEKPYKVGILHLGGAQDQAVKGMIDGMKDLGYVEGKNIFYYIKDTRGDLEAIISATQELFKEKPDMFYAVSAPVTSRVWYEVGKSLPIIFNLVGDPVGGGFAETWSSSATNLTGVSDLSTELSGKRLEVFKQAFPNIEKVITFYNPADKFSLISIARTREAVPKTGVRVDEDYVQTIDGLKMKLAHLESGQYDGIFLVPDVTVISNIELVVERAKELGIPIMGYVDALAGKGVTLTYGADFYDLGVQAAPIILQVLRGTKPKDIPVQTPEKLETVLNLKSAQDSGVTISSEFIEQKVDRLIEK